MGADFVEEPAVVPSPAGGLRAIVRRPSTGLVPGLVFVDGSGCGGIEEWGDWPARISGCGVAVLAHDKPATAPEAVDRVVTISGPGVTMAEQERMRVDSWLRRDRVQGADHAEGMAWVDERERRLRAGESAERVVAA